MSPLENKLVDILIDLKHNYNASALKIEFESEYFSLHELKKIKELAELVKLDLNIKISGCSSVRDLRDSKTIGANAIIIPMIESAYSLEKFVKTLNIVYSKKELKNLDLYINIESKMGLKNLSQIVDSKYFNLIDGVIFGRNDMASSFGYSKNKINSSDFVKIANDIAFAISKKEKKILIGGMVTEKSLKYFANIEATNFIKFETRKIVFKYDKNSKIDYLSGINKALEFEMLLLDNKQKKYNEDISRITMIKKERISP